MTVNDDFSKLAVVHTDRVEWRASPGSGVWRKRLDLAGPSESSRVTSVVRYDEGCAFPPHAHPDGEEILVLEGVFSDEYGDYPAGSYILNPEGFSHAPFSQPGCVIFVKLRQYPGRARRQINIDTNAGDWQPGSTPGVQVMTLYAEDDHPEKMALARLGPDTRIARHDHPGGEEVFVIEGGYEDDHGAYGPGSWVRYPPASRHTVHSETGCLLYLKTGHLAR
ncbi:MAG: cupin domain-containing protein [Proteobacteria bacterium]|nr:cupin domain-containing protein [Pseudomonadota bacterium]